MTKIISILISLVLMLSCKAQKNNENTNEMKKINIKKFEENKGKGTIYNHPDMFDYIDNNGYSIIQYGQSFSSKEENRQYSELITKEFTPYRYSFTYYNNGNLYTEIISFNNSLLIAKEYNRNGELVKETDFDKNFKHSFEQIHDFVLKEKNIDIYDTRQAVALRHDTPRSPLKKYYQIHVLKSSFVDGQWYSQPNYSFLIADETGQIVKSSEKK